MRHKKIPFLVVAVTLILTGMAFARDIPFIDSWTTGTGVIPGTPNFGLAVMGDGGGLPGFGDVLIGPFYDVRNLTDPNLPGAAGTTARAQATLISIVNTDPIWGVVARLRFREYRRSFECLDLDIVLTSNDVWVAQVVLPTGSNTPILNQPAGAGSRYVSQIPQTFNANFVTDLIPSDPGGIPFSATLIEGGDITRCQYGYFEVIGEEKVYGINATTFQVPRVGAVAGGVYTPGANEPANVLSGGRDVGNVLMGNVYIVRPDVAISHEYNMTAIANFAVAPAGIWQPIGQGTSLPTLYSAVQGQGANPGSGGFDNLEGLLSKRYIDFQYVAQGVHGGYDPIDTSQTPMSTSVVVTFPTKWAHYPSAAPFTLGTGNSVTTGPPFTGTGETYGDHATNFCEVVTITIWDRSEQRFTPPTSSISPTPVVGIQRLCYEVNVVGLKPVDNYGQVPTAATFADFRNNHGFPTSNANAIPPQKFFSGWSEIDISPTTGLNINDPRTLPQGESLILFSFFNNLFNAYRGLPALGMVMTEFYNDSPAVNGYYGNTVPWQYGVDWRNIPPDVFSVNGID